MKRPDKIKFRLVKPPPDVIWQEDLFRRDSVYANKLQEALNSNQTIEIADEDKYLLHQLKKAADKLKIRLLYGRSGDSLLVKPVQPSDQEKRLILLLREPRTLNDLASAKLELHLTDTLQRMASHGTAHELKGKWVLTEKGMDLLPSRSSEAGSNAR